MGYAVDIRLERYGFYPAGGGAIVATITPGGTRHALQLGPRGEITRRRLTCIVANLPRRIAEIEVACIQDKFLLTPEEIAIEQLTSTPGPGNAVWLEIESAALTECFTGFGDPQKSSPSVAHEVIQEAARYLKSTAAVGEHLADQLLLPLALAKGCTFSTLTPTQHTQTNADIIRRFLPAVKFSNTRGGRIDHTIEISV
jgi:RNA 3'-terminal phosphate cyclase (ATP)